MSKDNRLVTVGAAFLETLVPNRPWSAVLQAYLQGQGYGALSGQHRQRTSRSESALAAAWLSACGIELWNTPRTSAELKVAVIGEGLLTPSVMKSAKEYYGEPSLITPVAGKSRNYDDLLQQAIDWNADIVFDVMGGIKQAGGLAQAAARRAQRAVKEHQGLNAVHAVDSLPLIAQVDTSFKNTQTEEINPAVLGRDRIAEIGRYFQENPEAQVCPVPLESGQSKLILREMSKSGGILAYRSSFSVTNVIALAAARQSQTHFAVALNGEVSPIVSMDRREVLKDVLDSRSLAEDRMYDPLVCRLKGEFLREAQAAVEDASRVGPKVEALIQSLCSFALGVGLNRGAYPAVTKMAQKKIAQRNRDEGTRGLGRDINRAPAV